MENDRIWSMWISTIVVGSILTNFIYLFGPAIFDNHHYLIGIEIVVNLLFFLLFSSLLSLPTILIVRFVNQKLKQSKVSLKEALNTLFVYHGFCGLITFLGLIYLHEIKIDWPFILCLSAMVYPTLTYYFWMDECHQLSEDAYL